LNQPGDKIRLIVNADDLGWSDAVSQGILRAHREGIVTSTTLMTNMPGAKTALAMAAGENSLGVGVHLNLCQGVMLTAAANNAFGAGASGVDIKAPKLIRRYLFSRRLRKALAAEIEAQVAWAMEQGLTPTHIDSHRHVHAFWPIFAVVAAVARKYGIPAVRWPVENDPGLVLPAPARNQRKVSGMISFMMTGNMLRGADLRKTDAFYGIRFTGVLNAELLCGLLPRLRPGISELMVHPGLDETSATYATRLKESRPAELAALCDARVRETLERQGIERVHYGWFRA
jgi:predicted glycoside hydrolase/deacetylase ChbG (UPF0249 family)